MMALSPALASADTLGWLGGLGTGTWLGSFVGHGKGTVLAQVVLGLGLAGTGSRLEDGTYGRNGNAGVVYEYVPAYSAPGYDYGGVTCDRTPFPDGFQAPAGMCNDPDVYGATTTPQDLERRMRDRARRDQAAYMAEQNRFAPATQPAVYTERVAPATPAYPANMWERPENRQKAVDAKVESKARLNVENYMEPGAIPQTCQSKNWAVASKCLSRASKELANLQMRCLDGVSNHDCEKNPGVLAAEFDALAKDLDLRQKEGERTKYTAK